MPRCCVCDPRQPVATKRRRRTGLRYVDVTTPEPVLACGRPWGASRATTAQLGGGHPPPQAGGGQPPRLPGAGLPRSPPARRTTPRAHPAGGEGAPPPLEPAPHEPPPHTPTPPW